jgi:hypothetical protein
LYFSGYRWRVRVGNRYRSRSAVVAAPDVNVLSAQTTNGFVTNVWWFRNHSPPTASIERQQPEAINGSCVIDERRL